MFSSNPEQELYYIPKPALFKSWGWKKSVNPIYRKSCLFFGAILIDRTQTLQSGFNFKILDQIPVVSNNTLSFRDICLKRARSIAASTTEDLKVLWSGGIDSTVALISLLLVLKERGETGRLKIVLSKESVEEYPAFYHEVIAGKLKTEFLRTTIFEHITKQDVIVTGEHGDQLFGSDKLKYAVKGGFAFLPYADILDFVIARKLGTDKYTLPIMDFLAPQVEKSPVPIVTLYDYLWWMNFSLKWQAVSMRLPYGIGRTHLDLERNVFHFFKSADFQRWSIANQDSKIKEEWRSYKYVAKQFIYEFHRDDGYLLNKEKEQSLKEVLVNKNKTGIFSVFKR